MNKTQVYRKYVYFSEKAFICQTSHNMIAWHPFWTRKGIIFTIKLWDYFIIEMGNKMAASNIKNIYNWQKNSVQSGKANTKIPRN